MDKMKFNKDDKQKLIEFLNKVAAHAEFKMNTSELIEYFKLLNYLQANIIPKIDANILEVVKIHEVDKKEE